MSLDSFLQPRLDERQANNRYRQRKVVTTAQGAIIGVNGRELLSFCSNDYLGLANHPKVVEAFTAAAKKYGVGSGASHLVCGHSLEHHALEEELADFTGRDRALLFSTGYMANFGAIGALMGRKDAIFEDKLNHASLLDAGLSCGAEFQRFRHNDMNHLEQRLQASSAAHKMIVVDGVFSMDGDLAPLDKLSDIGGKTQDAWLMVDDAHGLGCLGATGAGSVEHFGLTQADVPILMGTLGKAFGSFGAFVAGSEALVESLIQFARTYIYTTALPPAVAAATRESLRLVIAASDERAHLSSLISRFKAGCSSIGAELWPSESPIQPILLGQDTRAITASNQLADMGFLVSAIRPPTVPEGSARLRVTLSAAHTEQQLDQLLDALSHVITPRAHS